MALSFGSVIYFPYLCIVTLKQYIMQTLNISGVQTKIYEYHRKPTAYEIKFGHGATHYKSFDESFCTKEDGTIKKRLKCPYDGLIYTR